MKKTNRCRSKQASPVDVSSSSASDDKQTHYEERVRELEQANQAFQNEIQELREKLANVSSASYKSAEKLKGDYLQKLNVLEEQVTELKKKQVVQSQLSTQRPKGDEATKRLQFEIQSLKAQKVQLQCKIKLESVQFRLCKASMEKEILQLKKEGRRNKYEMHKQLASNQRLKMVLQRKTEEASMATKRLKELLELRKASPRRSAGAIDGKVRGIQGIEHELEVTSQLHELCSEYEHQIEEMAEELAKLKEEAEMLKQEKLRCPLQEKEVDCLEKDLDIKDLKEQVDSLGGLVRQLKLQKTELIIRKGKSQYENQDDSGQPSFSIGSSDAFSESLSTSESENLGRTNVPSKKTAICCSCSKRSLCKTTKCRCRSAGGSCGTSCGCALAKCTNIEAVPIKFKNSPQSEMAEGILNCSDIVEAEKNGVVASQGALLLQSVLVDNPAERNDNPGPRKEPLRDIGNKLMESGALKGGQKKKGRKPVIQLVTVDPPPSLPENIKGPKKSRDK